MSEEPDSKFKALERKTGFDEYPWSNSVVGLVDNRLKKKSRNYDYDYPHLKNAYRLSLQVCEELGLSERAQEVFAFWAITHDVGYEKGAQPDTEEYYKAKVEHGKRSAEIVRQWISDGRIEVEFSDEEMELLDFLYKEHDHLVVVEKMLGIESPKEPENMVAWGETYEFKEERNMSNFNERVREGSVDKFDMLYLAMVIDTFAQIDVKGGTEVSLDEENIERHLNEKLPRRARLIKDKRLVRLAIRHYMPVRVQREEKLIEKKKPQNQLIL